MRRSPRSADYVDTALEKHTAETAKEALDRYIADATDYLERSGFIAGCPMSTVALEAAPLVAEIGDATAAGFAKVVSRVQQWLEREGMPTETAAERAALIYASLAGAYVFAKAQRSRRPLDRLRENLDRFLD